MPDFSPHDLNLAQGRVQVEELRSLLLAHADLREKEIRDFFESRRDLTALTGFYNPAIRRVDLVAREYNLFGAFRCDLAVGDLSTRVPGRIPSSNSRMRGRAASSSSKGKK
jgi:hypothetical protein